MAEHVRATCSRTVRLSGNPDRTRQARRRAYLPLELAARAGQVAELLLGLGRLQLPERGIAARQGRVPLPGVIHLSARPHTIMVVSSRPPPRAGPAAAPRGGPAGRCPGIYGRGQQRYQAACRRPRRPGGGPATAPARIGHIARGGRREGGPGRGGADLDVEQEQRGGLAGRGAGPGGVHAGHGVPGVLRQDAGRHGRRRGGGGGGRPGGGGGGPGRGAGRGGNGVLLPARSPSWEGAPAPAPVQYRVYYAPPPPGTYPSSTRLYTALPLIPPGPEARPVHRATSIHRLPGRPAPGRAPPTLPPCLARGPRLPRPPPARPRQSSLPCGKYEIRAPQPNSAPCFSPPAQPDPGWAARTHPDNVAATGRGGYTGIERDPVTSPPARSPGTTGVGSSASASERTPRGAAVWRASAKHRAGVGGRAHTGPGPEALGRPGCSGTGCLPPRRVKHVACDSSPQRRSLGGRSRAQRGLAWHSQRP